MEGSKEMKTTQSLLSRSCFPRSVILRGKKINKNCESDSHPILSSIGDDGREEGGGNTFCSLRLISWAPLTLGPQGDQGQRKP